MQFDTSAYLRRATSRAKSDVANKLISMLLHEISRRVVGVVGGSVTDAEYSKVVVATFGDKCCYCQRVLEADRASVEHLDGMNRFRIGLHIQGNVIVACKQCNNSKRRDDQLEILRLGESGWESFLAHDGTNCPSGCKTCTYWRGVWPNIEERKEGLRFAVKRISKFREGYQVSNEWALRTRSILKEKITDLYRACQASANEQIQAIANDLFKEFSAGSNEPK